MSDKPKLIELEITAMETTSDYSGSGSGYYRMHNLLLLDRKTLFNIHADPSIQAISQPLPTTRKDSDWAKSDPAVIKDTYELYYRLLRHGAVLHDGVTRDGKAIPAVQWFTVGTQNRAYLEHRRLGKLHDPAVGVAARQRFYSLTGECFHLEHYQDGRLLDPAPGIPAVQNFMEASGFLKFAISYDRGRMPEELNFTQLLALGKTLGLTPPLPEALRSFAPDIKPA